MSRVENGHGGAAPLATWYAMAAAVGLDLNVAMAPNDRTASQVDRFRRRAVEHLADIAEPAGWSMRSEIVIDARSGVLTTIFDRRRFARSWFAERPMLGIDYGPRAPPWGGRFQDAGASWDLDAPRARVSEGSRGIAGLDRRHRDSPHSDVPGP